MQSVIEHLRSHAPASAVFYRLVGRSAAGEYTLYPRDGQAFYKVGEAPRGLAPGLYQVFFFEASGRQIQTARVELSLSEATASALGPMAGEPTPRAGLAASPPSLQPLPPPPAQLSLPLSLGPAALAAATAPAEMAREQAEHRMRLERDQQQYNFIQNAAYAREVGEALMMNRMMRQEMQEMLKTVDRYEQDSWSQVEKKLAALRMIREAQKEMIADLDQLPQPPVPKPDWTPLIFSTIQTVQAIGMALVDKFTRTPAQEVPAAPGPSAPSAAQKKSAPEERPRDDVQPGAPSGQGQASSRAGSAFPEGE
jgi:hypothetical protein